MALLQRRKLLGSSCATQPILGAAAPNSNTGNELSIRVRRLVSYVHIAGLHGLSHLWEKISFELAAVSSLPRIRADQIAS